MWTAGGIAAVAFVGHSMGVEATIQLVIVVGLCVLVGAVAHEEGFNKGVSEGKHQMYKAFLEDEEIKAIVDGWYEGEDEEAEVEESKSEEHI
jgi:hypothetical protein